jgi:hypothetical protein
MVKSKRKPHSGATNRGMMGAKTQQEGKTWFRSPSHKLMCPDLYEAEVNTDHVRAIDTKAIWKEGVKIDAQEFHTTTGSSYTDPRSVEPWVPHYKSREQILFESAYKQRKDLAFKKLLKITNGAFGTTATMLKAVRY